MSKKPRVQINYKSGISMVIEVEKFTVRGNGRQFEWTGASPNPLMLGDDIESVWEL